MTTHHFALALSDAVILAVFGQVRRTSLVGNGRTPSARALQNDAHGVSISMGVLCQR